MLSHYWSNKTMLKAIKAGAKSNAISHMIVADVIVRNDEVVGSIPTSSTKSFNILLSFISGSLVSIGLNSSHKTREFVQSLTL
jgi:hypothetical protein